jgi:hypothetical protein
MLNTWIVACVLGAVVGLAGGEPPTTPGVTVRVYQIAESVDRIPGIAADQTPNFDVLAPVVDLGPDDFGNVPVPFVTRVIGELVVDRAGPVVFRLTSDDGSRLTVGGRLLIDHDGLHGATAKESAAVELAAGAHPLLIEHFDAGGSRSLRLEWRHSGRKGFERSSRRRTCGANRTRRG